MILVRGRVTMWVKGQFRAVTGGCPWGAGGGKLVSDAGSDAFGAGADGAAEGWAGLGGCRGFHCGRHRLCLCAGSGWCLRAVGGSGGVVVFHRAGPGVGELMLRSGASGSAFASVRASWMA